MHDKTPTITNMSYVDRIITSKSISANFISSFDFFSIGIGVFWKEKQKENSV